MTVLITGGAGFIGSTFVKNWVETEQEELINLDKLTYAGNLENLQSVRENKGYKFIKGDICNAKLIAEIFKYYKPRAVINFAAETHVDRSINDGEEFIHANVVGTSNLLQQSRHYWSQFNPERQKEFRFLQVSTDEVYGSLELTEAAFTETHAYKPNNPYSASKAAADHLVNSYFHTYGLPILITHTSNNYGPFQFPEKLIPLIIHNAINGEVLPIYGDGKQIRDWIFVDDNCSAIRQVLKKGVPGQSYNIGAQNEKTNIEIVHTICDLLLDYHPLPRNSLISNYKELIQFVGDRPGHDRRYAIDSTKIENELGWKPIQTFESGSRITVKWYLENQEWANQLVGG